MIDLLQIIENMVRLLTPFSRLIYAACFVAGVVFVLRGLNRASRAVDMGRTGPNDRYTTFRGLSEILTGAFLISLPGLLLVLSETFFGTGIESPDSIFAHAPSTLGLFSPGSPGRAMISGIIGIIQFIGIIAVIRGIMLLNMNAQGATQGIGPGVTFLVSGAMAVNFPLFFAMIERLITAQ